MSDPRFARFKSDPRFRRIRKQESKVVVDDRFKDVFDEGKGKKKAKKGTGRVDKYGRPLSDTHEQDNLRRFYRLENEDEEQDRAAVKKPDYARGEAFLESSDEEDAAHILDGDESDTGGVVTLGRDVSRPIPVLGDDDDAEIDLDEDNFADLDAQAVALAKTNSADEGQPETAPTCRLAVVNLDWDHVRAVHLYKIFSSLVSPTASRLASARTSKPIKSTSSGVVHGNILSVRVYPSEFGKERIAREEKEGPPPEVFKKNSDDGEETDDEGDKEAGDAEDYNEEALRKYQLERLRYYYAIVECDTVDVASYIYSELEGTELERSANVFDLSFVPDGMTFDEDFRDEATEDINVPYKGLEYVTDALRHSKRNLTRKEIEENDFKAYLASSTESESEDDSSRKPKGKADRDKLRALLLSGGDDTLPEGWGSRDDDEDVDVEITFTPGLSESKGKGENETTLEKYQRKMKEKRNRRKEEKGKEDKEETEGTAPKDDFFAEASEDETDQEEVRPQTGKQSRKKRDTSPDAQPKAKITTEELALIAASDNPHGEPKHFDMKAVLKAEKSKGRKRKGKAGKKEVHEENELQEDFAINVKDDRFKALHEDYTFAIDPSNPRFKKTKGMSALLGERSKRRTDKGEETRPTKNKVEDTEPSLKKLVESVKRKSTTADGTLGKRRKL
ncbi:hypothetical protein EW026_g932 [Hermanssonia centrifuga]|uniref:Uncharacterized protein n=1 Tax=Hermanssonia centrifuga TaxID=98765 RepID=A0A4S4KT65_9APHY|nr:hypothetical protein EW026_g932 [Hermanssonia centrifuga]